MTDTTEFEYTLFWTGPQIFSVETEALYGEPGPLDEVRETLAEQAAFDALLGTELAAHLAIVRRPVGSTSVEDYVIFEDTHEDQGAEV